ncbi:MAG: hypothetical protein ACOVMP_05485 [Chthoniobacterales bacterium]
MTVANRECIENSLSIQKDGLCDQTLGAIQAEISVGATIGNIGLFAKQGL